MDTVLLIVVFIASAVVHEVAHGYAANYLGDPTAKYQGRLTLNPIPHLDLFGSILLPALLAISGTGFIFGWAKPVPFNTMNLRDRRWGPALIALAGPAVNLLLAIVFGLLLRFVPADILAGPAADFFSMIVLVNLILAIFNLIPVPPLDGHHILFSFLGGPKYQAFRDGMRRYGIFLILFVIFFLWRAILPVVLWLFAALTGIGM